MSEPAADVRADVARDAGADAAGECADGEALLLGVGVAPLLVAPQQHVGQAGLAGAGGPEHDEPGHGNSVVETSRKSVDSSSVIVVVTIF